MSSIYLYAEVLLNIHQVTLHASLQTTRNEQTKIEISSDKHVITVFHDGQSTSLYLPTQISGNAKITIPAEKKKDLSVRLAIEDTSGLAPPELNGASDVAPWSAQSMSEDAMLRCKSCHAQILSHCQWQDLPSQNWFEMLDYWHCHKPEDDADHQQGDISSANQPLGRDMTKSKPGLGLVDVVSFLLNAKDCSNLNLSTSDPSTSTIKVECDNCHSELGSSDPQQQSVRLRKSGLSVKTSDVAEWETCSAAAMIAAQLLSLIESQATRRFVLHRDEPTREEGLMLWVFNPDIYYSTSARPPFPHRAMKIFYQMVEDPQKSLEENAALEELRTSPIEFAELKHALGQSTKLLPPSARVFQGWNVGLLDRYEKNPSEGMQHNLFNRKAPANLDFSKHVEGDFSGNLEGFEGLLE